ncbi:MAG: electron transporter SenC [Candidatus Sumerlaea sp.]|jgi:protein SCO1/2|uniref:SCO1/SenC family protein n=1 Tax=Sumerlaea chitinivorans TaxID=2250252 RepID=A0A2Z4Y1R6_SUMC1|nr:SCO1/SenC family protein [Candidatus Sumerlaea chitinivorans]GIX45299.1 MAG: electron transporter SenC [Candidatus Sumerlaea sp.]
MKAQHLKLAVTFWTGWAALFLTNGLWAFGPQSEPQSLTPPTILREVGVEQKIGQSIPLNLEFVDETGTTVSLARYFGKRPVVITPVYFECPMLCTQVLNGLSRTLKVLTLDPTKDFTIVTYSFDPRDTPQLAAAKKANYLQELQRPELGQHWAFLTGSQEAITSLSQALGFRYVWDEKLGQYAHAAAIMVLTPEGKIARYFYGIEYPPRDLRFGLVEASEGRVGSPVDQLLLLCYQYDPMTGKYGWIAMTSVRIGGLLTVLAIAGFIAIMLRKEFKARREANLNQVG